MSKHVYGDIWCGNIARSGSGLSLVGAPSDRFKGTFSRLASQPFTKILL